MTTATLSGARIRAPTRRHRSSVSRSGADRDRDPGRAGAARRPARIGGADPGRLRPRHRLPESRVQLHRIMAALSDARGGGRPARRPDRDRRRRTGGCAGGGARSRISAAPLRRSGHRSLIGAFVFGIGMQLANGCGSGTLYTVGGGSGRMLIALLFFVIGSVIGSLSLPSFLALGGIDPMLASDYLGPWGGLAATLVSIALAAALIIAVARRRGANLHAVAHLCTRRPRHRAAVRRRVRRRRPSLERDLRLHGVGRENRQRAWLSISRTRHSGNGRDPSTRSLNRCCPIHRALPISACCSAPWLRPPSPSRSPRPPGRRLKSLLAAAIGGLLMGWGARLGFGCNIGAFVGGVASGSLHGWVWFAAALPGCLIGIRLRPLFGLSRD